MRYLLLVTLLCCFGRTGAQQGGACAYTYSVKAYGAAGDSSHDDTKAIQRAIDAAKGNPVYLPKGVYLVSGELRSAGPNVVLNLAGEDKQMTCLKAVPAYTGNLLYVTHSIHIHDLLLVGNARPGMTAIRADHGGHGDVWIAHLKLVGFDYGIRMDGKSEFPLKTELDDIYIQNVLTCGIKMGTDSTPTSGQSALELRNIVVTNPTMPGQFRTGASPVAGFGWCLMQRNPKGQLRKDGRPINVWQTAHYVADKDALHTKTDADHQLVQRTVGLYFRYFKSVDAGVLQCEYLGTGVYFDHVIAMNIGSFYYEWRQNFEHPIPQGDALVLNQCTGVSVQSGWAEMARSAVSMTKSRAIAINTLYAANCTRSAVNINAPTGKDTVQDDHFVVTGGTPVFSYDPD